jgi:hypothetical protein
MFVPLIALAMVIAGIVLVTLGLRGRPVFSMPRCSRCSYDLRALNFMTADIGKCPECGADLSAPGAVNFAHLQRRPGTVVLGMLLTVSPLLLLLVLPVTSSRSRMAATPAALPTQSTAFVLSYVAATVNQPWGWQELEKRLAAGQLSVAEVDKALATLTVSLNKNRAAGRDQQPLSWTGRFVELATSPGAATPAALSALYQAFYGAGPEITMSSSARRDEPIDVQLEVVRSPWNIPGSKFCWSLRSIEADGAKLSMRTFYNERSATAGHPDQFSGGSYTHDRLKVQHSLAPGDHELTFTFDLGAVPERAVFRGLDGKPGPPEKWPAPIAKWQTTVKRTIHVVGPADATIALITDPQSDPLPGTSLKIEQIVTRPATGGLDLVIKWKYSGQPSVPLSYHVTVQAGDQKIDYGNFFLASLRGGTTSNISDHCTIASLGADVKTVDVLLTPDAKPAEQNPGIDQIWGEPLSFKKVPVERFDLEHSK